MKNILNKSIDSLGGLSGVIGGIAALSLIKDTSSIEDAVLQVNNTQVVGSTNDSLMLQYRLMPSLETINYKDLLNSGAQNTMSALGTIGAGSKAGSSFGPVGSIVGAAVGGLGSLFSKGARTRKAKKTADKLNKLIGLANQGILDRFQNSVDNLSSQNNLNSLANIASNGGMLTEFNNGGTHLQNPYGGIIQGIGSNGLPNLVEEGETKIGNYVFSNKLKVDKKQLMDSRLKFKEGTFADVSKRINRESKDRPNDIITKNTVSKNLGILSQIQENKRMKGNLNMFEDGGFLKAKLSSLQPKDVSFNINDGLSGIGNLNGNQNTASVKSSNNLLSSLGGINFGGLESAARYAPVIGSGIASLTDALGKTNKVDYSYANDIDKSFTPIQALNIGNKMQFNPLDLEYAKNLLRSNSASTKRSILQLANGNRGAAMLGLMNAGYQSQLGIGDLTRKAAEYNDMQRKQVQEFNRGTNMYNSEMGLKSQMYNSEMGMKLKMASAQARELARQLSDEAKLANLNNFLSSLSGIGKEATSRNMINSMQSMKYGIDRFGNVKFNK